MVEHGMASRRRFAADPLHSAGGSHGYFAMYAQYAHYTNNGWEIGGEYINVSEEGVYTNTPWCYL